MSASNNDYPIKCVVWDLDNTVWQDVLLEGGGAALRTGVVEAMTELDQRGIVQSIASRNDHDAARTRLLELGVWDLFVYPQIHWDAKSASIQKLSQLLNLGLNTFAFIDDDPFERDEVQRRHRDVLCVDPSALGDLLRLPRATPAFITPESKVRRQMYRSEESRSQAREDWPGTDAEFLATLGLRFEIRRATRDDLQRAEELTVRTNQLNSTGKTYSYDELETLLGSTHHVVLVASLSDRYGSYGTIGLCVMETAERCWRIDLLLMSCRVLSRGVGGVMLAYVMSMARRAGVKLQAEFVPTERNRVMYVAYRFAGFSEVDAGSIPMLLEANGGEVPRIPDHLEVVGLDL